MKYIIILVFILTGCALPLRREAPQTTDIKIINCVDKFLDKNLTGKSSFDICGEIYRRRE